MVKNLTFKLNPNSKGTPIPPQNGDINIFGSTLDNRGGNIESGNSLDISVDNLIIDSSRFFATNILSIISNLSLIDENSKFLSLGSIDLTFNNNLVNKGEITATLKTI